LTNFCARRTPVGLRDQVRLDFAARWNSITIVERRPPAFRLRG
jgi:hypothetical protein